MAERTKLLLRGALVLALALVAAPLWAQPQVRFGTSVAQVQPVQATTQLGAPQPGFDPYGSGAAAQVAPALPPTYPQTYPTTPVQPVAPAPAYNGVPVPPPPIHGQAYPAGAPPAVYPNGINFGGTYGQPAFPGWQQAQPYVRLFNKVRFQYTWMDDSGDRGMGINDLDLNLTAAFPNFLFSADPLYVTPGFTGHLWDGPDGTVLNPDFTPMDPDGANNLDVPPRAYSAYLGFGWQPRLPAYRQFGADLSVIVGVYSDFNAVNTDSLRIQGTALLVLQLTPTLALKGGIMYLDRVDIKMLPAGGLVWTPDDRTEFNFLFPNPKFRKYWTTLGQTDVWWYISGEYGGGSWSVEHTDGVDDRMDINDIRIGGGLDFVSPGGRTMWVEAAYVFNRELYYAVPPSPANEVDLSDTLMLRGGISF